MRYHYPQHAITLMPAIRSDHGIFRMKYIFSPRLLLRPVLLLLAFAVATASAQDNVKDASMRDILEAEQKAEQLVEEKERSDPNGFESPRTPLTSMLGLRSAMRESKYTEAVEFLDTRFLPEDVAEYEPETLIKALSYVWAQQNIIDLGALSDEPGGHLDDGLPSYRDQVGSVTISTGEVPIYLQHVPDGKGGKVWRLSNATVARIPEMWDELGYNPIAIKLRKILPDFNFMGMANWQLTSTLIFMIVAWPLASLASTILMRLALLIPNRFPLGIQRFFRGPARFFLFIFIGRLLMNQLGLSLTARVYLESSGIDYVAYTVLLLGLLSLVRDYQIRRMEHAGNAQYAALLKPLTIITKVLVVTILALIWADQADAG